MKRTGILSVLILVVAASAVAQNKVEDFEKYAEAARQEWKVPGMAITVVQHGKVILAKGYGVRELSKDTPVDADTLFGAMSTTKAMTAVTMGMLVDEGKVSWDDKVVKHLPDFRVADAYVTSELRIRDLFTHNGGMGNADFLWTVPESMKWLRDSVERGNRSYTLFARDPLLNKIRQSPEFIELMAELKLEYDKYRSEFH